MALFTAYAETPYVVLTADTSSIMEVLGDADVTAKLVEFSISFNGTTASQAPILVKLRQITATGTGTACTEVAVQRTGKTAPQCQAKHTLTVEPTMVATVALGQWYVHPQGGMLVMQYPLGREPVICDGSAAQGLAIELTSASGVTPTAACHVTWEE
jgi:hypothetical protein